MSRTVNGQPLSDVLIRLREEKSPSADKGGKFKYFRIKEFVETFDSIVGIGNYNVEYTDLNYSRISTGQEKYSVKCRISILSDDGDVLLIRESYGDYTCQYEKETGKDVNLQNSSEFACHAAFKNAAKRFGIFGRYNEMSGSDEGSSERQAAKNNVSSDDTVMNFVTDGPFVKIDERDGRPVYRLDVHEIVGENCRKDIAQLIFYPNQYGKDSKSFNSYYSLCANSQKRLRAKVKFTRCVGSKKQYVFKSFVPAA